MASFFRFEGAGICAERTALVKAVVSPSTFLLSLEEQADEEPCESVGLSAERKLERSEGLDEFSFLGTPAEELTGSLLLFAYIYRVKEATSSSPSPFLRSSLFLSSFRRVVRFSASAELPLVSIRFPCLSDVPTPSISPCGICRQFIREFCALDVRSPSFFLSLPLTLRLTFRAPHLCAN